MNDSTYIQRPASTTAMFPVIGILFIWVAIGNILTLVLGDQSSFFLDILIFLFLAFRAFRDFRKFRSFETEAATSPPDDNDKPRSRLALARRVFPAGGCAITALSIGAFACVWLGSGVVLGFDPDVYYFEFESIIYTLTIAVSIMAFAVSSASLLAGYGHSRLAAAGMVSATLAFLCQILLFPINEL